MLRSKSFTPEQIAALASDYRAAGLEPLDEAIAAFTERVVLHAEAITGADFSALRAHGLDDAEIFDIVLAASARIFFSRANDAIGYQPSPGFLERIQPLLGEQLLQALMVGRQFGQPAAPAG